MNTGPCIYFIPYGLFW